MKAKEITALLQQYGLNPNKNLGQNFLCNDQAVAGIISISGVSSADTVLEIGPGLGVLTRALAATGARIIAVEIDAGMVRLLSDELQEYHNITLLHADFLKTVITEPVTRLVANLPYYCATELIFSAIDRCSPETVTVMLQKEMAQRITAQAGTPSYGALTVSLGYRYKVRETFNVSHSSFYPPPDVTSTVVHLEAIPHGLSTREQEILALLIRAVFWGRRKTMTSSCVKNPHHSFSRDTIIGALQQMHLAENIRGEQLTIEQFKECARFCAQKETA